MTCVLVECSEPAHRGGMCVDCYRECVGPPFQCAACGANYHGRGAAIGCCAGRARSDGGTVAGATTPHVSDAELIRAIRQADSRCVNGLPDPDTISDECPLSAGRISDRLRDFESEGRVDRYPSLAMDVHSQVMTVEVAHDD